ncbi:hypothetical protein BC829DRAFT_447402 [Chytridium lagenaria]|nr:hypothetical protein BC829DRAFT_447402 [Chytridium lagenaria]
MSDSKKNPQQPPPTAAPPPSKPLTSKTGTAPMPPTTSGGIMGKLEDMDGTLMGGVNGEDSVVLTVRVVAARNVRGAKGEHVNTFMRVQFADFDYKDSPVVVDNGNPEYGFVVEQSLHVDEGLVDTFSNKRVTFTLIESLPKEKTQILGTSEVSLGPVFLKYQPRDPSGPPEAPLIPPPLSFKESLPITYLNPRRGVHNQPEIMFEAMLSKPLLAPEVVENGNFLTIRLEDVFPVPDEWTLKEGTEKDLNSNIYTYNINLLIPSEATFERHILIPSGLLTTCEVPITPHPRCHPIYLSKPPDASPTNSIDVSIDPKPDSIPQTPATSDKAAEVPMQSFKKVTWGGAWTVWLPPESVGRLREKILAKQMLEIEFSREFQPKFAHLVDSNPGKYRGKALLDAACLLFPRVIGMKGRFALDVFDPLEVPTEVTATKRLVPTEKEENRLVVQKTRTLGTSVGVELVLEKPLLDKKKLQPITKSVSDFIPRRIIPDDMVFEKRSLKADDDYRIQIQEIVRCLVTEYQVALTSQLFTGNTGAEEEEMVGVQSRSLQEEQMRRKKFLFHLNKNGSYFSFKERLKTAVVDIRFQRKSPFASKSELQLFMSEVYVYLVDQMHVAINKMFHDKETAFTDPTTTKTADFSLLSRFAKEAEEDHNVSIATSYHQERISKYEDSFQAWFDYGTFCMRNGMASKGVECLKEVVARNGKHFVGLWAICSGLEKYDEARVFLVTAVELQPTYVLGLTILGLFYDIIGEEEESEKYLSEATKLHKASSDDPETIFMSTARFLVTTHAPQLAERALSQELLITGPSVSPYLLLAQLEIQKGNHGHAFQHVREALEVRQDDPDAWTFLANAQFVGKMWAEAQLSYETVLSLPEEPKDLPKVYIRLGTVYLTTIKTLVTITGSKIQRCDRTQHWGDFGEAEDAFSEANVLNNRDGEVWAHLALLSQALRVGVKDAEVLKTTGTAFFAVGCVPSAAECLRMAIELDPHDAVAQDLFMKAITQGSREFLERDGLGSGRRVVDGEGEGD